MKWFIQFGIFSFLDVLMRFDPVLVLAVIILRFNGVANMWLVVVAIVTESHHLPTCAGLISD